MSGHKFLLGLLLLAATACTSPPSAEELADWRLENAPLSSPRLVRLEEELEEIDALRQRRELDGSRDHVLALLKEHPRNPAVLWRAARAETDLSYMLRAADAPRRGRDLAAASSLEYARAARRTSTDPDAELLGQLAWSLGATTHLEGMFDRDQRASDTRAAANFALTKDPDQITALTTLATLHLRISTLPWIARLFSSSEGSLEKGIELAYRCAELEPSLSSHLLLAKLLAASERNEDAIDVLNEGLNSRGFHPRDTEVRNELQDLRDDLLD